MQIKDAEQVVWLHHFISLKKIKLNSYISGEQTEMLVNVVQMVLHLKTSSKNIAQTWIKIPTFLYWTDVILITRLEHPISKTL